MPGRERGLLIHDSFNLNTMDGVVRFLIAVFKGTFVVEMIGALIYMITFIPKFGVGTGIWYSVFTAISAFCNAGIDILGLEYNNPGAMVTGTRIINGKTYKFSSSGVCQNP